MHILILNWRDIKNPLAGGAEQLTHEIARRWVRDGHTVKQISARFSGCLPREIVDGVTIVRLGQWWNVAIYAAFYYVLFLQKQVDVIIDEVHWFPYFSKLYSPKKTVLLACEVANRRFYKLFPYPIAAFFRLIERLYLRLYRNVPTMAISPSTKQELVDHGFSEGSISVIPMGVTLPDQLQRVQKEKKPTVLYLGRLNKLKGAEDAIDAFCIIHRELPSTRLWMVGGGERTYVESLKRRAKLYNLQDTVRFYGFVTDQQKFELLMKANVLIVPSIHEGWGLTVHEAAAVATPSVVYDVPGLRDTIDNGKSGLLVEPNARSLASGTLFVLADIATYSVLSKKARMQVKKQSWDNTAAQVITFLRQRIHV